MNEVDRRYLIAVGVVMERRGLAADQAMAWLRVESEYSGCTLESLVDWVVSSTGIRPRKLAPAAVDGVLDPDVLDELDSELLDDDGEIVDATVDQVAG